MQRLVRCQICGQKIAKASCVYCGKSVCEIHWDNQSGLCVNCKQGKRVN